MFFNLKQPTIGYKYSLDSYLIADFCEHIINARVLEIGSGCGIIAFLLAKIYKDYDIRGIEIQQELIEIAKTNLSKIKLDKRISFVQGNICNILDYFEPNQFDIVISNPPYYKNKSGRLNKNYSHAIAKHELTATLDDFIKASERMLKNKGSFFLIYTAERVCELIYKLRLNAFEPKSIRFIHPKYNYNANQVLLKALKKGNSGVKILPPLYIYKNNGEYTDEMKGIFHKFLN